MDNMEFDHEGSKAAREVYRRQGWFLAMDEVYLLLKQFAVKSPYAPHELTEAEQYVVDGMIWVLNKRIEEKKNENIQNDGKACDADCSGRVRSATGETGGPDVGSTNG